VVPLEVEVPADDVVPEVVDPLCGAVPVPPGLVAAPPELSPPVLVELEEETVDDGALEDAAWLCAWAPG
jgi:hypothetical protein